MKGHSAARATRQTVWRNSTFEMRRSARDLHKYQGMTYPSKYVYSHSGVATYAECQAIQSINYRRKDHRKAEDQFLRSNCCWLQRKGWTLGKNLEPQKEDIERRSGNVRRQELLGCQVSSAGAATGCKK